jgi:hypothetical protein
VGAARRYTDNFSPSASVRQNAGQLQVALDGAGVGTASAKSLPHPRHRRPLARVSRLRRLLQKQAQRAGCEDLRREEQRLAVIEQNLRALKPVGLVLKEQWQAGVCVR